MPIKQVKAPMLDCLGQVITVGDVVIQTNCSYTPKPHVVTRLGATTMVQVDGGSYVESGWLVKINEQYKFVNGVAVLNHLIDKHKSSFNHIPVQDKPAPTKYVVVQAGEYDSYVQGKCIRSHKRYFLVTIVGKTITEYCSEWDKHASGFINSLGHEIRLLNTNAYDESKHCFSYFQWTNIMSKRKITDIGLDFYINPNEKIVEITDLSTLQKYIT